MADLAARVRKELGGVAGAQMRSLSMLSTKLGESFQALFTGVNLEPLLRGLFRLTQLLSQNTESGRALRAILSTVLGVFIGELADTTPRLEYLFKELVILALRGAIAFFQVKNAIERAFGNHILGRLVAAATSTEKIRVVLIALGLVVVVLAAGVALLTLAVVGLFSPFLLVAYAMYHGYLEAVRLITIVSKLREYFAAGHWTGVGQGMINGIVAGLQNGVARLRGAVRSVAATAMGEFRSALGIASPSRVFAELGLAIPQGVAEGVERGSPEAAGAVGNMVSTTTNNVAAVQGGPSRSVQTGEIHIHVGGEGEAAEDTARRVTDALRDFFETGLATEPA